MSCGHCTRRWAVHPADPQTSSSCRNTGRGRSRPRSRTERLPVPPWWTGRNRARTSIHGRPRPVRWSSPASPTIPTNGRRSSIRTRSSVRRPILRSVATWPPCSSDSRARPPCILLLAPTWEAIAHGSCHPPAFYPVPYARSPGRTSPDRRCRPARCCGGRDRGRGSGLLDLPASSRPGSAWPRLRGWRRGWDFRRPVRPPGRRHRTVRDVQRRSLRREGLSSACASWFATRPAFGIIRTAALAHLQSIENALPTDRHGVVRALTFRSASSMPVAHVRRAALRRRRSQSPAERPGPASKVRSSRSSCPAISWWRRNGVAQVRRRWLAAIQPRRTPTT